MVIGRLSFSRYLGRRSSPAASAPPWQSRSLVVALMWQIWPPLLFVRRTCTSLAIKCWGGSTVKSLWLPVFEPNWPKMLGFVSGAYVSWSGHSPHLQHLTHLWNGSEILAEICNFCLSCFKTLQHFHLRYLISRSLSTLFVLVEIQLLQGGEWTKDLHFRRNACSFQVAAFGQFSWFLALYLYFWIGKNSTKDYFTTAVRTGSSGVGMRLSLAAIFTGFRPVFILMLLLRFFPVWSLFEIDILQCQQNARTCMIW